MAQWEILNKLLIDLAGVMATIITNLNYSCN